MRKRGLKVQRSMMRLTDVNSRILSELEYKLVCHLKLAAYMVWNAIREFVNDSDEPRKLVGFGVDGY